MSREVWVVERQDGEEWDPFVKSGSECEFDAEGVKSMILSWKPGSDLRVTRYAPEDSSLSRRISRLEGLLAKILDDATGEAQKPDKRLWPIRSEYWREATAALEEQP